MIAVASTTMTTMTFSSKRSAQEFPVKDLTLLKQQMLYWANQFSICCLLDNNRYQHTYHSYECMLAVNVVDQFSPATDTLSELKQFLATHQHDWLFGHFSYHSTTPATKRRTDPAGFPAAFLFQPETVITLTQDTLTINTLADAPAAIYQAIMETTTETTSPSIASTAHIQARFTRTEYLDTIHQLQQHILRGDCYEINFCQEFYAEQAIITPLPLYQKLIGLSPTPYAAFYKLGQQYALCASPERYIKKEGNTIISQPIKGTAKRIPDIPDKDEAARQALRDSEKDKSENVMVVDLVRNDLSKVCTPGSVQVEELFGIYSFPQVHQMISTIKGELLHAIDLADVLEATFPMGSMTGAPKKKVMELTDIYERSGRGLYSGCIGYITPDGDYDFNVVIRSMLYNAQQQYLSYQVGGGITFYSNAEKEYEECLLKAAAIQKALQ